LDWLSLCFLSSTIEHNLGHCEQYRGNLTQQCFKQRLLPVLIALVRAQFVPEFGKEIGSEQEKTSPCEWQAEGCVLPQSVSKGQAHKLALALHLQVETEHLIEANVRDKAL
jgi:hypothetical protein